MNEQVQEIFIEDIIPNRFQPRLTFDEKALQELSDSIKVHGVIQPLVLRKVGNKYEIIAGERRYKASCMAGLKKVPAIVREMTDNESAEVALIENVQRKNLSSIEEAQSYRNLLDRGYLTQEELAQKLGVSQSTIANKMRLLNLCDEVQNALLNEQISERHARSLLQLSNPDNQKNMLNRIIKERLTVKQLDMEIKKLLQGSTAGAEDNSSGEHGGREMIPNTQENSVGDMSVDSVLGQNGMPNKNFLGISLEPPTDLETSAPNLSIGLEDTIPPASFNPFSGPTTTNFGETMPGVLPVFESDNKLNTEEAIETFDMFGDVVSPLPSAPSMEPSINPFGGPSMTQEISGGEVVKKSIGDQVNTIRDSVRSVESNGYKVEMEEYDFEDMYQIILKIKK